VPAQAAPAAAPRSLEGVAAQAVGEARAVLAARQVTVESRIGPGAALPRCSPDGLRRAVAGLVQGLAGTVPAASAILMRAEKKPVLLRGKDGQQMRRDFLMLALTHRVGMSTRQMDARAWGNLPPCGELTGATVGIVGFGDIGRHLAALLTPFRCEVLAIKRTPAAEPTDVAEMLYGPEGLDELMRRADHVCLCLPGTPETRGIIDGRRLALMKPTACLYNVGRGYTVDTDALTQALAAGESKIKELLG
jgi:hypothetical protein